MFKTMFNLPKISGNKTIFFLIIAIALIAWTPKPAMATTWYVHPGESIHDAINGASAGDIVYVYNGTYNEVVVEFKKPNITLKGEGADVVTIDFGGAQGINIAPSGFPAPWAVVDGFTFINSPYGVFVGYGDDASNSIVRNCVFEGLTASGGVNLMDTNTTFENNRILNATGSYCALYMRDADSCIIVNNTITSSSSAGILLILTTTANNTITRNNISSNGKGLWLYQAGSGNKIYLNDIYDNTENVAFTSQSNPEIWNSTEPIVYVYNGTTYTGQMGNYWGSDYTGTDANGDGIGDTPYPLPGSSTDCDSFPLMQSWEDYQIPDFSLNGYVDAADLQLLGDHWHFIDTDPGWDALYDLVADDIIDAADLQVFGDHWHEGTPPKSDIGGKDGKGPNVDAGIVFDLDAATYGNQNLTGIPSQPAGTYIPVDVYCTGVNNLDTYEFEVIYDATELTYISSSATNPITYEPNILTTNGGTALGWMVDSSTPGVLSIAYTLAGNDPAQAPEGEGLIADIVFQALVATHGTLSFGDVYYYDSYGVVDLITDTGTATLPVELSSFTAAYNTVSGFVSLCWATASETDVNGFNIYRNTEDSFVAADKINIDLIAGSGTTTEPTEYSFTDETADPYYTTYYYWLEVINFGGTPDKFGPYKYIPIDVNHDGELGIITSTLSPCYPNPSRIGNEIKFNFRVGGLEGTARNVELKVYNILGKLVAEVVNGERLVNDYTETWNPKDLSNGVYFYQLKTENYNEVKKMLIQ